MTEVISILLDILQEAGQRGLPLAVVSKELETRLARKGFPEATSLAGTAIENALDSCLIDKVIDEPEGFDIPSAHDDVWFLRALRDEETRVLQSLPEVERRFLRLLHTVDIDRGLGMMREDVAVAKLRELGFDVNHVPWIDNRLETQYESEDGKTVKWYCLIPEYLRTEDYRSGIEALDDKLARREVWFQQLAEGEECEKAGTKVRKKKSAASATKKETPRK